MTDRFKPLLDRDFLRAELYYEFQDYLSSDEDDLLKHRLRNWGRRELKRETQAEASFVQRFFVETWNYSESGTGTEFFQLWPKFPIAGAGQTGSRGEADLAVGIFGGSRPPIPQIVCEFKDIRSGLDKPQNRKGNTRSPVIQARDYLWNARRGLFGNEPVQPRFAIVTDMDEFRLYWWDAFPERSQRFRITPGDLFDQTPALLGEDEESAFDRFLFWRLFRHDMLLADAGRPRLERLIERQGKQERKLEADFYEHYRHYRRVLISHIVPQRPAGMTKGAAVRLAQKLLDRLIFVMFAEDMGARVGFPVSALVDQLRRFSGDPLLEPSSDEVWRRIKLIFDRMNTGGDLGGAAIHRFNGGLFVHDPDIDGLHLPNSIFVRRGQARSDANIAEHKDTLLFLAATYNYAREGGSKNSIGLYTLGHIFEQSIVELEKLEADADERPSLTELSKRKLDGVYYTPEWVVQRIVEETLDPLFERWRARAGWKEGEEPTREAAAEYWERLQRTKIVDPACGSGAFLIVALRHMEKEFAAAVEAARRTGAIASAPDASQITRMILAENLFGVDINPASVEITRLSLWLHTAEPKQALSVLDDTIQCGNSLVDNRFYNKRRLYDPEEKDRINTFDWEGNFAVGSFDAVIGNPPYVKLQNFVQVNSDVANWLVRGSTGEAPYESTTTGNFDLYLPFVEKGLSLLNHEGRLGFIAPSLWPRLENGQGLRQLVHAGRHLEKWLDFRSFQVFEDVTVYTAIQIFSKTPVEAIQLSFVPDGDISKVDWSDPEMSLPYEEISSPSDPWLMAPRPVRSMIGRLNREATPLGHIDNTKAIFQGIITSADHIYHMRRIGKNRYAHRVRDGKKWREVAVDIEDSIMKPLVTGGHIKRFIEPSTGTFLLFPYEIDAAGVRLLTPGQMQRQFPNTWKYLKEFEKELRGREKGASQRHSKAAQGAAPATDR